MRLYEFLVSSSNGSVNIEALRTQFCDIAKIESFNPETGHIICETTHGANTLEKMLCSKFSHVKLIGQSSPIKVQAAGVAIIGGDHAKGIVRLLEDDMGLHVEGTVSGLQEGAYTVSINEYGDISNACLSTGNPISKKDDVTPCGLLGKIKSNGLTDTQFTLSSPRLSIMECIGRSLVVQTTTEKIACGIVGRSSGVSQNTKKVCACDGKLIWEEQSFGPYAVAPPSKN